MNDRLLHRTRRQHYLIVTIIVLIAIIIGCVWILDSIHSNESLWGWTLMLQCLIPLLSIVLAGVFVSLPGKIVRSKVILALMFVAILCLCISVYANLECNKQPSLLETILFPFNSTLASFFPSIIRLRNTRVVMKSISINSLLCICFSMLFVTSMWHG